MSISWPLMCSLPGTLCADLHGTMPGRLLRFDLDAVTTSLQAPSYMEESYVKGIIEEKQVPVQAPMPSYSCSAPGPCCAYTSAPSHSPASCGLCCMRCCAGLLASCMCVVFAAVKFGESLLHSGVAAVSTSLAAPACARG